MKRMRRAVLVVFLTVLGCAACWQCWAALGARGAGSTGSLLLPTDEASRVAFRRIARKTEVTDRLLAGEITLLEAAACFRHINDNPPEYRCDFRLVMPGASDGEKACRQVISWVHAHTQERHGLSQADLVADYFERVLGEILAADRGVELPW
jgi:proteasome lid subunit RPN8/RPN11